MYLRVENLLLTRLVPLESPGPIFKFLFRIPLLLYRLGLGPLLGNQILVLSTTGRRSGNVHRTPLEYFVDEETGRVHVIAGWAGRTDWFRNAKANPKVGVQIGRQRFEGVAEPVPDEKVANLLLQASREVPESLAIWSRWAGRELRPTFEDMLSAASKFPALALIPDGPHHAGDESPG